MLCKTDRNGQKLLYIKDNNAIDNATQFNL